jgi:cell division protease FtsH
MFFLKVLVIILPFADSFFHFAPLVKNSKLFDSRRYDLSSGTRNLIRTMKENNNTNAPETRPGYPRQAHLNITYPKMGDDDFDDDDDYDDNFVDLVKKTNDTEHGIPMAPEQDENFEKNIRDMFGIPMGIRVVRMKQGPGSKDEDDGENARSENFEVIKNPNHSFDEIGGYEKVKEELMQTVDILKNYEKYSKYNVRTPKGLILEGPPGNGKTLIAKGFSGEVNSSFIAVSGSNFLEKYVGVGASRIRELFKLAKENKPCIIFIDEIDAVGRSRSSSEENSNAEAQSTLNELLVAMDGFSPSDGIFVVGATNRVDLLDPALTRPGRIDKQIYIGKPDAKTREAILDIHIKGKPKSVYIDNDKLLDLTNGLSGAQIENLLNEAMLLALRSDREMMIMTDLEEILARMLVGYQSTENVFSEDMIYRIAVHELGHATVGMFAIEHAKLTKICLNVWSPTSPGYTIFENEEIDSNIYTKEKLLSRLMVLQAGRIAEEVVFGNSITSGASKDIEETYRLAEQMIVKFGMGRKMVYTSFSESSKSFIDKDIEHLVETTYEKAHKIVSENKIKIEECAKLLIEKKTLVPEDVCDVFGLSLEFRKNTLE